jgi:hypothetical protein
MARTASGEGGGRIVRAHPMLATFRQVDQWAWVFRNVRGLPDDMDMKLMVPRIAGEITQERLEVLREPTRSPRPRSRRPERTSSRSSRWG